MTTLMKVPTNAPGNQVPVRMKPNPDPGRPRGRFPWWGAMLRPLRTETAR